MPSTHPGTYNRAPLVKTTAVGSAPNKRGLQPTKRLEGKQIHTVPYTYPHLLRAPRRLSSLAHPYPNPQWTPSPVITLVARRLPTLYRNRACYGTHWWFRTPHRRYGTGVSKKIIDRYVGEESYFMAYIHPHRYRRNGTTSVLQQRGAVKIQERTTKKRLTPVPQHAHGRY